MLPELDDAFAAQVSEHETLDALRAAIEAEVAKALEQVREGRFRGAVMAALGDGRDRRRAAGDGRPAGARPPRGPRRGSCSAAASRSTRTCARAAARRSRPWPSCGREAEQEVREELALRAYADRYDIQVTDEELEAFIRDEATREQGGRRPRRRAPHRQPGGRRAPRGPAAARRRSTMPSQCEGHHAGSGRRAREAMDPGSGCRKGGEWTLRSLDRRPRPSSDMRQRTLSEPRSGRLHHSEKVGTP